MGHKIKPKDRFGCTPKKGTKARTLLRMTLRCEGITGAELKKLYPGCSGATIIGTLRNEKGWDIRSFNRQAIGHDISSGDHSYSVYRCVGRMFWDGRYRSFIK